MREHLFLIVKDFRVVVQNVDDDILHGVTIEFFEFQIFERIFFENGI